MYINNFQSSYQRTPWQFCNSLEMNAELSKSPIQHLNFLCSGILGSSSKMHISVTPITQRQMLMLHRHLDGQAMDKKRTIHSLLKPMSFTEAADCVSNGSFTIFLICKGSSAPSCIPFLNAVWKFQSKYLFQNKALPALPVI